MPWEAKSVSVPRLHSGVRGKENVSVPHRQAPHCAQVAQQLSDSLLELREAGQRVGRLQLARVVQPGLQNCQEGGEKGQKLQVHDCFSLSNKDLSLILRKYNCSAIAVCRFFH